MTVQIESKYLSALINYRGAELCSVKNRSQLEYIWRADKDVWQRHAPVLFPIVGKLKGDSYSYDSKQYKLSQHGFARDMDFELVQSTPSSCTFELHSNPETKKSYPFDFIFRISYWLEENKLFTNYRLQNPSTRELLYSLGAHPGFRLPLLPDETFEDYYIEFENSSLEITELEGGLRTSNKRNLVLPNRKLNLTSRLFDKDALVFEGNQINSLKLASGKSPHGLKLDCPSWPYFGIWSKKSCREFICLEPWYGIADSTSASGNLNEKDGLISLSAGQENIYEYAITFF